MSRNSAVIGVSPQIGNRRFTTLDKALRSLTAFSIKSLLLFAAFLVLFLEAKAQVQGWEHKQATVGSIDGVLLP